MKYYLRTVITLLSLVCIDSSLSAFVMWRSDQIQDDGYYYNNGPYNNGYDETVIWVGPGWYGGFWFDDEVEFNDWHHHHYHNGHWNGNHGNYHRRGSGGHGGHSGHGGGGHGGHGGHSGGGGHHGGGGHGRH